LAFEALENSVVRHPNTSILIVDTLLWRYQRHDISRYIVAVENTVRWSRYREYQR